MPKKIANSTMENMSSRERERNKRKNNISYYENGKHQKNEEINNYTKEGRNRATKLIEIGQKRLPLQE